MPVMNPSRIVPVDAEAVREAIEEVVEESVRSLVEYDTEGFNPLYVADESLAFYEDDEHMTAHFEQIHSYVNLDFTEIELFTNDLLPITNRVEYIATRTDALTIVRVFFGRTGLFVAVDPETPVDPVVDAIEAAVDDEIGTEFEPTKG